MAGQRVGVVKRLSQSGHSVEWLARRPTPWPPPVNGRGNQVFIFSLSRRRKTRLVRRHDSPFPGQRSCGPPAVTIFPFPNNEAAARRPSRPRFSRKKLQPAGRHGAAFPGKKLRPVGRHGPPFRERKLRPPVVMAPFSGKTGAARCPSWPCLFQREDIWPERCHGFSSPGKRKNKNLIPLPYTGGGRGWVFWLAKNTHKGT